MNIRRPCAKFYGHERRTRGGYGSRVRLRNVPGIFRSGAIVPLVSQREKRLPRARAIRENIEASNRPFPPSCESRRYENSARTPVVGCPIRKRQRFLTPVLLYSRGKFTGCECRIGEDAGARARTYDTHSQPRQIRSKSITIPRVLKDKSTDRRCRIRSLRTRWEITGKSGTASGGGRAAGEWATTRIAAAPRSYKSRKS